MNIHEIFRTKFFQWIAPDKILNFLPTTNKESTRGVTQWIPSSHSSLSTPFALLFTFAIGMEETQRDESVQQWNTTTLEVFYPFRWVKYFLRFFNWFSLTRDPGDGVVMC